MSKKNGKTKATKKLFPKTIWVENFGTKKHPDVTATHDLDKYMMNYMVPGEENKPTVMARYELVEVGTLETTIKFKAATKEE
jgi:hypothetical protein